MIFNKIYNSNFCCLHELWECVSSKLLHEKMICHMIHICGVFVLHEKYWYELLNVLMFDKISYKYCRYVFFLMIVNETKMFLQFCFAVENFFTKFTNVFICYFFHADYLVIKIQEKSIEFFLVTSVCNCKSKSFFFTCFYLPQPQKR